jgi:hypothetical protein
MSIPEPQDDREGKHDDESRALLVKHEANAALVIVIGGKTGTGFSFSTITEQTAILVPAVLRQVADEIEKDFKEVSS